MIATLAIVEEDADECLYWIELPVEGQFIDAAKVNSLMIESNEIVAMIVTSIKTLRSQKTSKPL